VRDPISDRTLKVGLGVWRNPDWLGSLYPPSTPEKEMLETYASVFNAVEGNTTFHAVPTRERLRNWASRTPEGFEFFFKFPRQITHQKMLYHTDPEILTFLDVMSDIRSRVGTLMIQLPPAFNPSQIDRLLRLKDVLPPCFNYAVEFRNPGFFSNPKLKIFDLVKQGVFSLVILDNQLGFAGNRMPSHKPLRQKTVAIDPGPHPVVRYVDRDGVFNFERLAAWGSCLQHWVTEGRCPAFFAHTESDRDAPDIARLVGYRECNNAPVPGGQLSLF
jgi:uncharacterized protein YecE (DUF72 family)